jgi:ABC-type nitrate/sulfonate/bicarbonate transport system substrate-binding protein
VAPSPKPFAVTVEHAPSAGEAPLYEAVADGRLRAAGLAVTVAGPPKGSTGLQALAAGQTDMDITDQSQLMLARDQGSRLVAVAALGQQPLGAYLPQLPHHAATGGTQAGGTQAGGTQAGGTQAGGTQAGGTQAGGTQAGGTQAGGTQAGGVSAGAATAGGTSGAAEASERQLAEHAGHGTIPADEYVVLVVRVRQAEDDGEDVRAVVQALTAADAEVRANPSGAAALVLRAAGGRHTRAQLAAAERAVLGAVAPSQNQPYGYQSPTQWESFARWMYVAGLLHTNPTSLSQPYTDEYLAGQGL